MTTDAAARVAFAANTSDRDPDLGPISAYCISSTEGCPGVRNVPSDLDSIPSDACATCIGYVARATVDVTEPCREGVAE